MIRSPLGILVLSLLSLYPLQGEASSTAIRLTSVFNNILDQKGLKTGWGYACLIEGMGRTVLFDTGADGDILLDNMRRLGKDPADVDIVVISHIHHDHIGGLDAFLTENPTVTVYVPASFPPPVREEIRWRAELVEVSGPMQIAPALFTTGELGRSIREQALVLKTGEGLVVVTGCAHPGIVDITRKAKELHGGSISLVMGGFHLISASDGTIGKIIAELQSLGVEHVAPSHCTGDGARALFREAWGTDFLDGGLGSSIAVEGAGVKGSD